MGLVNSVFSQQPLHGSKSNAVLAGQLPLRYSLVEAGNELLSVSGRQAAPAVVVGLVNELPTCSELTPASTAAELRTDPNRHVDVSGRKELVRADQELWVRKVSNQERHARG
jgi:hypothetical protein